MRTATSLLCTFIILILVLTLLSFSPRAGASDAEWYGAIKASISEDTIDSISQSGIGTGAIVDGILDGVLEDDNIDDYTAGFGQSSALFVLLQFSVHDECGTNEQRDEVDILVLLGADCRGGLYRNGRIVNRT